MATSPTAAEAWSQVEADEFEECNPEFTAANKDLSIHLEADDGEECNPEFTEANQDLSLPSVADIESDSITTDGVDDRRSPSACLVAALVLVGGLEGADAVLLPCVFYALQRDIGLSLNDLALMSMVQALAGNLAAPAWGILADRGAFKRRTIIVTGCVAQGLVTMVLAGVDGFRLMVVLRALNGAMLASLRPIMSGIVADVTSEGNRGKVYGAMGLAMNVGTAVGTLVGTNLGRKSIWSMQGWRVAFLLIGGASVLVGFVAVVIMPELPRGSRAAGGAGDEVGAEVLGTRGLSAVKTELLELWKYFKLPSFCVLILQGCFGSVPWNALGYKTLFFQLGGISDLQASAIDVASQVAGSLGALLGGTIGDRLSRCSRHHGRPLAAQLSVMAGVPVAWLIFMQQPPEDAAFAYYLTLMVVLGLTATWCGVGVNLPILSEIVTGDRRATIMAWEGALESSCSAIFGNAMVGYLAQNVFGYDLSGHKAEAAGKSTGQNIHALGSALMLVSFFPWLLCFVCYSLLHWSYGRDLERLRDQEAACVVPRKAAECSAAAAAEKADKTVGGRADVAAAVM